MKTNEVNLSFLPSSESTTESNEPNRVLESVVKDTAKQARGVKKLCPYSITATLEEVHNKASAKLGFTIEGDSYVYDARSTVALHGRDEGRLCLVTFEQGDISKPIITGIIQRDEDEPLVLSSEDGIVLECGDTRIVLDVDGTLDLKAQHINSQAYGPYRIKGGSVKIN